MSKESVELLLEMLSDLVHDLVLQSGDRLLLACHGDEGAIVLPELAPEVAATQRWHTRLTVEALQETRADSSLGFGDGDVAAL